MEWETHRHFHLCATQCKENTICQIITGATEPLELQ